MLEDASAGAARSTSRPSTTSPGTIPGGASSSIDHVQNTSPEAMDEDEDEAGSVGGGAEMRSPAASERGDMDVEEDDVDADADVVSRGLVSDEDARALYAL